MTIHLVRLNSKTLTHETDSNHTIDPHETDLNHTTDPHETALMKKYFYFTNKSKTP